MKTTVRAAMLFALLVDGSLAATATNFSPSPDAAKIARPQTDADKRGTLYAMRPSDPRFHSG